MTGVSEEVQDNAEMGKVPYRPVSMWKRFLHLQKKPKK